MTYEEKLEVLARFFNRPEEALQQLLAAPEPLFDSPEEFDRAFTEFAQRQHNV